MLQAGVVDQNINPVMRLHQGTDHRRDVVGVADITTDGVSLTARGPDALGNCLGRLLPQILHQHAGASAGKFLGDGGTNAASSAGDQGGASGEDGG